MESVIFFIIQPVHNICAHRRHDPDAGQTAEAVIARAGRLFESFFVTGLLLAAAVPSQGLLGAADGQVIPFYAAHEAFAPFACLFVYRAPDAQKPGREFGAYLAGMVKNEKKHMAALVRDGVGRADFLPDRIDQRRFVPRVGTVQGRRSGPLPSLRRAFTFNLNLFTDSLKC